VTKNIKELTQLLNRDLLIIDFEATCWEIKANYPAPLPGCNYTSEIIEFGVIHYSANTQTVINEFQAFVRPVFHSELSDFCTNLTSITQADVDSAKSFPEVMSDFINTFNLTGDESDPVFCSYGAYDQKQLIDDCKKHNIDYPFSLDNHLNIKPVASNVLNIKKTSMKKLITALGMQFDGTQHRGIDDARNLVSIIDAIYNRLENSIKNKK